MKDNSFFKPKRLFISFERNEETDGDQIKRKKDKYDVNHLFVTTHRLDNTENLEIFEKQLHDLNIQGFLDGNSELYIIVSAHGRASTNVLWSSRLSKDFELSFEDLGNSILKELGDIKNLTVNLGIV